MIIHIKDTDSYYRTQNNSRYGTNGDVTAQGTVENISLPSFPNEWDLEESDEMLEDENIQEFDTIKNVDATQIIDLGWYSVSERFFYDEQYFDDEGYAYKGLMYVIDGKLVDKDAEGIENPQFDDDEE